MVHFLLAVLVLCICLFYAFKKEGQKMFEITVSHSDKHDGMVTISGFEDYVTPLNGIVIDLDTFKEALDEAGYEIVQWE